VRVDGSDDTTAASDDERADEARSRERLAAFLRAMLPIAVGFESLYIACAFFFRSGALAGGAAAVALYTVAVASARKLLAAGRTVDAAMRTGWALLVMVALGAPFLSFLTAALVIMPIAGVALVLPYAPARALRAYLVAALVVITEVIGLGTFVSSPFAPLPHGFEQAVVTSAAVAAAALTIRLLAVDHRRAERLLLAMRGSLAAAQRANEEKDAFLVGAVHDLRTPLAALFLDVQALSASGSAAGDVQARRLARLGRQAKRLTAVVDRLVDVARITSGGLDVSAERVDLAAVVRHVAAELADEAEAASAPLAVSAPSAAVVHGDPVRVGHVVTNLVSNALKFGRGAAVDLEVREGANATTELVVADRGIGVPPEERERIFDRFARGAAVRSYPGLGLGLWITRELAQAMNASIAVTSTPGGGATFVVRFRRAS